MERPKRQKTGSSGKTLAFEKLKQLKSGGGKHKIDIGPMENVYEEVTEDEYTENVLKRQQDDWIVDDFGAEGYVEDGREIFDDDLDEESIQKGRKSKKRDHSGVHKKLEPPKGNIQKMLANMPAKKNRVMTGKDDILEELMENLDEEYSSETIKPAPLRTYGSRTIKIPSNDDFKRFQFSSNDNFGNTCSKIQSNDNFDSIIAETSWKSDLKDDTIRSTSSKDENDSKKSGSSKNVPLVEKEIEKEVIEFPEDDFDFPNTEIPSNLNSNLTDSGTPVKHDSNNLNGNAPKASVDTSNLPPIKNDAMKSTSSEFVSVKTPLKSNLPDTFASWSPCANENAPVVNIDCSKLPLIEKEDGTKVFRFFYWDAYEDVLNKTGTVYLFGKVCVEGSEYASCCISVKNIKRRIYLLPREKKFDMVKKQETDDPVLMGDVHEEWSKKIAAKHPIIDKFQAKQVSKNYAFNLADVPDTSDYLEVRYGAEYRALSSDVVGETFSRVFGTNTSFLEIFLVERRIKGPCWLEIVDPVPSNPLISWCKFEVTCDKMANISVVRDGGPPPPLVVVSLNMRITPIPPKSIENQITMISCLVQNKYHTDKEAPSKPYEHHFCAFTKPERSTWPYDNKESLDNYKATKLDKVNTERGLLGLFLAKFHKIDPDLIVGHDICGFDIGTLVHRLIQNKVMNWSRIGRLRRFTAPNIGKGRNFAEKNIMCGRLLCDIAISARELIKARSYDLDTICQQVLNIPEGARKDLNSDEVRAMYRTTPSLLKLIELTMLDASYILRIMYTLNAIPLSLQITNIAGNVLSRTLMGGRAERNEYLLLHAFNDKDYIVPDKSYGQKGAKQLGALDDLGEPIAGKGKRKPQYEGGLVLEPKKGFYDTYILLMDFNSLYPSIIQEYNICFTTVSVRGMALDEEDINKLLTDHLPSVTQPGILPTEIRKLVESRRAVKTLMAKPDISPDLKHQYDIRQLALKLTANSMYGCLGFPNSRFYAKPLAAMVTAKGRDILVNTRELVQKLNFDVIYGDTDSLMINTNSVDFEEVFKIGHKIKIEVNKLYRQIELDIDGVFKYMLLLKKKKYAAVTLSKINDKIVTKQEIKGLDVVRRDWSPLSANAGRYVLNQLLCDQNLEDKLENIHSELRRIKTGLEQNTVQINELKITKQLTKNPEDYPDKKSLPHVQVALRMNQNLTKKFKQGDSIFYVVCEDGTTNAATQRAYHVDELKNNADLKIDVKYYLSQQVHPVVTRLCEPIEGIDAVQIAESLGLDSSSYIKRVDTIIEENEEMIIDETDKFKNCEKFEFPCTKCGKPNVIESPVVKGENNDYFPTLLKCTNPICARNPMEEDIIFLQNKLLLTIRSFVHKYYQDWMVCEEPTCNYRTRVITNLNRKYIPLCPACGNKNNLLREFDESQLYNQLSYFEHLFDIEFILTKIKNNRVAPTKIEHSTPFHKNCCKLKEQVNEFLNCNAYNIIDFGAICRQMLMK